MTGKHYRLIGWLLITICVLKDIVPVFLNFTSHPSTFIDNGRIYKAVAYDAMYWKIFWNVTFDIFIWIAVLLIWWADRVDSKKNSVEKNVTAKGLSIGKLLIICFTILVLAGICMFIFSIFIMSKTG